ncbi:MAG TPA: YkgJ family cysteine cluster protein, partial [Leptospiraceae bacterium]|nr:YkgJ family cysteine cluster protein [Leptospiraceae bacterium]
MIVEPKDLVPFACKATGKCCIHNLVLLSSFDIFRLAKSLSLTAKDLFEKKYLTYRINPVTYWMQPILNEKSNSTCPFLVRDIDSTNEKYICDVYEARPLVCRLYPLKFDKDENIFMRFLPAEYRCYECITTENNPTLKEYLDSSNSSELLEEFKRYLALKDKVIASGLNLNQIKKNKP